MAILPLSVTVRAFFRRARAGCTAPTTRTLVALFVLFSPRIGGAPRDDGLRAPAIGTQPRYSSSVNLVEVYVTVTGADGEPVTGLSREEFEIEEDGVPQTITVFAPGSLPLSVALAIDRSWSMTHGWLALAKGAARSVLDGLRPGDRAMVVAIGSEVKVVAPLSEDLGAWMTAVDSLETWGTTPLHDAVIDALDLIRSSPGRRALILISDGSDRYSSATAGQALERARRADVIAYPVAVGRTRPPFFVELAALTGGRSFEAVDLRALRAAVSAIGHELRDQYLLGYTPAKPIVPNAEQWRSLRVSARRDGVRVRAREGYWAR
jgi:Ca-activated chloride channel homolog